jgi:hypothetical protein
VIRVDQMGQAVIIIGASSILITAYGYGEGLLQIQYWPELGVAFSVLLGSFLLFRLFLNPRLDQIELRLFEKEWLGRVQ